MKPLWRERLARWVCTHFGHRWGAHLNEHGKPYDHLVECRRCHRIEAPR